MCECCHMKCVTLVKSVKKRKLSMSGCVICGEGWGGVWKGWGGSGAIYEQRMLNDTDLFLLTQSD